MAEHKIFIVEDDSDLAEMLSAYFRTQGYTVSTSIWGEDAVNKIIDQPPHVVVLDIRLPDIDGYEVCRRIRKSRRTQNVPVIFLTERREREDKLAGLELGAVDYITKPFDIQELRLRIRNALRRASLQSMNNPITSLAEGPSVLEQMEKMLDRGDWGVVLAGIRGLTKFRDQYGFVAADDVTRAVSLMLTNAMQESGADDDFIGHTNVSDFIVLTNLERCAKLAERCRARLQPSVQYFYPAVDRQRINQLPESERLTVHVECLTSRDGPFSDIDSLRSALDKVLR